jgi:murein DD-endopeptidase MepM/ murein hydrolase activator NlpD
MSDTFRITAPHKMRGSAVKAWQEFIVEKFAGWDIDYPLTIDGVYGVQTRAATATLLRAWGVYKAVDAMKGGVSPELRIRVRNDRRDAEEEARFRSSERVEYRRALRRRLGRPASKPKLVSYPINPDALVTDSWGYHPGVHDGVDLICPWKQPVLAICEAKVVRVSKDGWWGLGAKPSPGHPVSDGDGIVIIQALDSNPAAGIKKGDCFGYGHSELHVVKVGDVVKAGQRLGVAGWANAPHVHFMLNRGTYGKAIGRGDADPQKILDNAYEYSY